MIVISDTSPISALLKVKQIKLLAELFGEVVIPTAVHTELLRAHPNLPSWLRIERVTDSSQVHLFQNIVDAGETEAIQLARELNADRLLINDFKGRQLAESQGLHAIGVVGVLLLAKRKGLVHSVRIVINALKTEANVYLSDDVVAQALRAADE